MKKIGVILNNKKLTCGGMKLGKCIIDIHHVGDNNVYFPKKKKGFGKTCIIDLWTKKDGVKD